ncbi:MAG: GNAT family N-acetyltransferase [Ruminococcus sp.]|nr:GNAT family N-acetyltransferase [Ruminococcus sp.]MCM1381385.1 GNAT family N-acetyltransferase [Muribaculaceae bacterium]MCM1478793.1 GNAT family N-acetyltransferase [Muribaculaceae bacterium]
MKEVTLETERLILRPLTPADAEDVFLWAGDEEVARYMSYPTHENVEVTKEWLSSLKNLPDDDFEFGFVLKENGTLIGSGGILYDEAEKAWKLGYNFRRDCWGKGYATETAKRMIEFARSEQNARTFAAYHAVGNPASGRVLEKCGFEFSHFGEYSKLDGSQPFKAKFYKMKLN